MPDQLPSEIPQDTVLPVGGLSPQDIESVIMDNVEAFGSLSDLVNCMTEPGDGPPGSANVLSLDELMTSVVTMANASSILAFMDREGRSLLHYAAGMGLPQTVGVLLDIGIDANAVDDKGFTPMYYAELEGFP